MTERESKLYLALLERPEMTAAELHRISGVMRTKTYETLEHMVSMGFCQERVENKRRYFRAVQPAKLKEMLQQRWEKEHAWRKRASNKIFGVLDERFVNQNDHVRSLDFIEVIRSKEQIHRRYLEHIIASQSEVLTFNRSPYACVAPEVLKEQEKAGRENLERGVTTRSICMMEGEYWSWLKEHVARMGSTGEEFRLSDRLPMKMFIFDREKVMLALPAIPGQTETDFTMLIVQDEGFTESCLTLFNYHWDRALTPAEWKKRVGSPRETD
jgi:predicted transcriptional regulator